jgi:predicted RNA binding protein YcfA (HicA-like mRNA interferase family)
LSPKLRRLSGRDVVRALERAGFAVAVTRGSHAKLHRTAADAARQVLNVPLHKERAPGTLQAIYRQALRFVPESALRSSFYSD